MVDPSLSALANELATAVEITLNPQASQQARMEAYIACEKFKEISPLCAQAGLFLVTNQFSAIVKHFGLQLMEHQVKFNWNKISQDEKIFIKDNTMKLLSIGIGPAEDKSLMHIKDALSRIVVEMIKREWPQQWPTLLTELSAASEKGLSQTELVALVFLRLVEDVALLQTIESNQRRKDIYQALTVNMGEIFDFFLTQIEKNVSDYVTTKNFGSLRVVIVVLNTLASFVEWVNISHIMASDGRLLKIICYLLEFPDIQLAAAECLNQITNRKGVAKDKKPLLYLFNDEPMQHIFRSLELMMTTQTESYYQYLKKLTQAMYGLTNQLTSLCGKESDVQTPPRNFFMFLQIILAFARHPSLSVTHGGILIWLQLIKHDTIAKDPIFADSIRVMIEIIGPKLIKRPYPKVRNCFTPNSIPYTTEAYTCLDFDSEEDYLQFIPRFRVDLLDIFRQSTLIAPLYTFSYCEHWLNRRLDLANSEKLTSCSIMDPVYLEWEAVVAVLDGVLSRILLVTERPSILSGLGLLKKCLTVKTDEPLIYSVLLSCISSLFVFLSMSASGNIAGNGVQLLPPVLEKIFSAILFTLPVSEDPQSLKSAAVKNLRRHAASSIVKIALKYPLLLLPIFEQINTTVKSLCAEKDSNLSNWEKLLLQEALLIISNHFCEFERQQLFVAEIIRPAIQMWQNISMHLKMPNLFIEFVGLSKSTSNQTNFRTIDEDVHYKNRQTVLLALNTVLGVIKRCQCPDDPDKSVRGGFVVATTDSGNPITRNPSAPHVIPLLQHILALMRCLNELYNPSSLALISNTYKGANQMLENEKKNILGVVYSIPDPLDPTQLTKVKTPFDYMQQFLSTTFDNCYHLMGAAGLALGRDFYSLSGLSTALINSCFSSMEHIPDFRLRTIIRVFLRPFIYSCPTTYHSDVIVPIFAHISPFMLSRLTARWDYICSLYENGALGDDTNNDAQEVLDDILNRTLTREYLDVLKVALVGGTAGTTGNNDITSTEIGSGSMMDQDDFSMDALPHITRAAQAAMQSDIISELGKKLLANPITCESVVFTIFNCIAWNDSNASLKACLLAGPVIRHLSNEVTPNLVTVILTRVLQGLQLHGQHDANQPSLITLGVQVYEIARPLHPSIVLGIMQQIPNLNINDLQKLDEKILNSGPLTNTTNQGTIASTINTTTKSNKIDKTKKDLFKKITSHLVGRNVLARMFRNPASISELTPLNNNSNQKITNILESSNETGLQMQNLFREIPR
ncbi:hypothetical protein PVAND_006566 [Polypedilum vanderplanki]|uniref:Exportin-5 n=1 Tax=Polypedilum vanderplanki TaxID=319348 RepID=A0A9J6C4C2_POLVA|nr:hypothetical protein PVAND_006566 [Polypedilum vanderplanki]